MIDNKSQFFQYFYAKYLLFYDKQIVFLTIFAKNITYIDFSTKPIFKYNKKYSYFCKNIFILFMILVRFLVALHF